MSENNNVDIDNNSLKNNSTWEVLKQARAFQKQQNKIKQEEKRRQILEKKKQKKTDYEACKIEIKKIKEKIKNNKLEYKQTRKQLVAETKKENPEQAKANLANFEEKYFSTLVENKNKISTIRYDFGKKYGTILWKTTKGFFGIKKEFNRIIWSRPIATFKYLSIIIIIVGFLSVLFFILTIIADLI